MRVFALLCFFGLTTALSGCGKSVVHVKLVDQFSHCSISNEIREINSEDALPQLLGQKPLPGIPETIQTQYPLDFKNQRYLLVGEGQKPTPGYTFILQSKQVKISGKELPLPLSLNSPPKDAVLAQVITQPCVLISLSKGKYTEISMGNKQLSVQ